MKKISCRRVSTSNTITFCKVKIESIYKHRNMWNGTKTG